MNLFCCKHSQRSYLLVILFLTSPYLIAQGEWDKQVFNPDPSDSLNKISITDLEWVDNFYLEKQENVINELLTRKLGSRLHRQISDLSLLQRIIDNQLIKKEEVEQLQAMGVVLGNVLIAQTRQLQWKVYEDKYGRSRALCVEKSNNCLFVITLLSRRLEVGLTVDVKKIFNDAVALIHKEIKKE